MRRASHWRQKHQADSRAKTGCAGRGSIIAAVPWDLGQPTQASLHLLPCRMKLLCGRSSTKWKLEGSEKILKKRKTYKLLWILMQFVPKNHPHPLFQTFQFSCSKSNTDEENCVDVTFPWEDIARMQSLQQITIVGISSTPPANTFEGKKRCSGQNGRLFELDMSCERPVIGRHAGRMYSLVLTLHCICLDWTYLEITINMPA